MKLKLVSLVAALVICPMAAQADVVFTNKTNNTLEVTYKLCNWFENQDHWICAENVTTKVNSGSKNYTVITIPELPQGSLDQVIFVMSSVAKDGRGNVIAEGSYDSGTGVASIAFDTGNVIKLSKVFNFNSVPAVNGISMDFSQYQYVGPDPVLKTAPALKKNLI